MGDGLRRDVGVVVVVVSGGCAVEVNEVEGRVGRWW